MSTSDACSDYDNDRSMDIYLVNSGKCDFFDPPKPLRNTSYHNMTRDGTFTDADPKRSGTLGTGVMEWASGSR